MRSPSSPSSLLQPTTSRNIEEDNQEFVSSIEQQTILSSIIDDDDLNRKVERCFRHNSEQELEDHFMEIDQKLTRHRSHFRYSLSNSSSYEEEKFEKPFHSRRMRSVSTTIPINNEIKLKINSTRRRKSTSSTGLTNDFNPNKSNNSETNLIIVIQFYINKKTKYFILK
jgi:hypothetical protein